MLLEICTPDDLIAADDFAEDIREDEVFASEMARLCAWEEIDAERAAEEEMYGSEADDAPLPETRILRPWHQNKAIGPWGPKGPKGKRVTLRSHRTGR